MRTIAVGMILLGLAVGPASAQAPPLGKLEIKAYQTIPKTKTAVQLTDDTALGRHTELEMMDLSLLRAGAKSGQLPKMFLVVADRYEVRLRDGLKQLTTIIEPVTILFVAIMVAILAVAVMLSLVSVYGTIA